MTARTRSRVCFAALAAALAARPAGADPVPVTTQQKSCQSLYGGTQGTWSLAFFTSSEQYDDVSDDCAKTGPSGSTYYVGLFDGIGAPMGSMATNIRQPNLTDPTYTG
jgi:hypothetical protein